MGGYSKFSEIERQLMSEDMLQPDYENFVLNLGKFDQQTLKKEVLRTQKLYENYGSIENIKKKFLHKLQSRPDYSGLTKEQKKLYLNTYLSDLKKSFKKVYKSEWSPSKAKWIASQYDKVKNVGSKAIGLGQQIGAREAIATPEQWGKILTGQQYQPTIEQAKAKIQLGGEITPGRLPAHLRGKDEPEVQEQIAQITARPQSAPPQKQTSSFWQDILRPSGAISGGVGGLLAGLREEQSDAFTKADPNLGPLAYIPTIGTPLAALNKIREVSKNEPAAVQRLVEHVVKGAKEGWEDPYQPPLLGELKTRANIYRKTASDRAFKEWQAGKIKRNQIDKRAGEIEEQITDVFTEYPHLTQFVSELFDPLDIAVPLGSKAVKALKTLGRSTKWGIRAADEYRAAMTAAGEFFGKHKTTAAVQEIVDKISFTHTPEAPVGHLTKEDLKLPLKERYKRRQSIDNFTESIRSQYALKRDRAEYAAGKVIESTKKPINYEKVKAAATRVGLGQVAKKRSLLFDAPINWLDEGLTPTENIAKFNDEFRKKLYDKTGFWFRMIKDGKNYRVVEENLSDILLKLYPIARGTNKSSDLAKAGVELWKSTIRPAQKNWRAGKTILRPAFFWTELPTNFTFAAISNGIRAADPRIVGAAAARLLPSAFLGSKLAQKKYYKLADGTKKSIKDIMKMAQSDGILRTYRFSQGLEKGHDIGRIWPAISNTIEESLRKRRATEMLIGPGKVAGKVATAPYKASLAITEAADDFFKLQVYMKHLKGSSDAARAHAADMVGKYMPHYRRMSDFEKSVMRDGVSFYGWLRWSAKYAAQALMERPARLTVFQKAIKNLEHKLGGIVPVTEQAIPEYLTYGVTAPIEHQHPEYRKRINEYIATGDKKVFSKMDDHRFGMMTVENTWSATGSSLEMVHNIVNPKNIEDRRRVTEILGPAFKLMLDLTSDDPRDQITGWKQMPRFPTQAEIEDPKLYQIYKKSMQKNLYVRGSMVGEAILDVTDRYFNLYRLATTEEEKLDMRMRYQAVNDFGFIPYLLESMGAMSEGRAAGPWYPGVRTRQVDPYRTRGIGQMIATKEMKEQLKRSE
jgi:hypothetical protein